MAILSSLSLGTFVLASIVTICLGHNNTKVVYHEFDVHYFLGEPNGVRTQILGVNDQFPGPTIYARIGDLLIVKVINNIQTRENTSIHWHGLDQYQTLYEDGPEYVTQCPIVYGSFQIYQFQLKQAGTYWWHSHHSGQYTEGFWGLLIVSNKPEIYGDIYNEDHSLTLNDWYHDPIPGITNWYLSKFSEGHPPVPDSLLINGKGFYPCSVARQWGHVCTDDQQYTVLNVHQNSRIRLRIVNTAALVTMTFSIDNHKMYVIEVDGVDTVFGRPVDVIKLAPAQRYSVIVVLNGELKDYWIRITAIGVPLLLPNSNHDITAFNHNLRAILRYGPSVEFPTPQNSSGILATQGRPATHDEGRMLAIDAHPYLNLTNQLLGQLLGTSSTQRQVITYEPLNSPNLPNTNRPLTPVELIESSCRPFDGIPAPTYYDEEFRLNADMKNISGRFRWTFNNNVYTMSPNGEPALYQVLRNFEVSPGFNPIKTTFGKRKVVQFVINNRAAGGHPFHLHGHTFWILGTGARGEGDYNIIRDESKLRIDGVRRDTLTVEGNSWAVARYYADNPGTWLLHCHIQWHLQAGLGLVFIEGEDAIRTFTRVPDEWKDVCKRAGLNVSTL